MIELYESVLGCLLSNDRIMHHVGQLTPDDFVIERHSIIFQAMMRLDESGEPHDLVSVTEFLRAKNCLDKAGGAAYLTGLIDTWTPVQLLSGHAGKIKQRAVLKTLIEQCEITMRAVKHGDFDAAVAHQKAVNSLLDGSGRNGWVSLYDASVKAHNDTIEACSRQGGGKGLSTGIISLDDALGGLQAPDLIIIGARPGMGKTALALTIAAASRAKVGFFSLEMQDKQLAARFLAGSSGVTTSQMRTGQITDDGHARMAQALERTESYSIWIDDAPGLDVTDIKSRAMQLQAKHGLDLLIVDYLQLATAGVRGNRVQDISEVSRKLKELAKVLDVPIIALAQLNRKLEERADKRPVLSDLRDSGQLEQDADIIMFLYRQWVYNKGSDPAHTEMIISKFRNGQPQTVNACFIPEKTTFTDW